MGNHMRRTLVIILLFVILFPWAQAQGKELLSGNELVEMMREYEKAERKHKSTDWYKAGQYLGFVTGFYDATWFFYADRKKIGAEQIADVVAKFLNQHPEKWNRPAWDLVMEALQETFPRGK